MTIGAKIRRALRKGESGQAIVLLAIGFVILLGFVGLVTDLSLLFVRFTALRRAVDSAAVAAAGQYSRTESDAANLQKTTFAARQFLEFHGVDPSGIIVRTCESIPPPVLLDEADRTDPANAENNWQTVTGWNNITDQMIADAETAAQNNETFVDGEGETVTAEDRLSYLVALQETAENVCDPEERNEDLVPSGRKLVQVEAGITVPTTFMSLFGQNDFYLTAAAVSETASLDVIIVLDVSQSMLDDTTYDDYNENLLASLPGSNDKQFIRYRTPNTILGSNTEARLEFLENYRPEQYYVNLVDGGDGFQNPQPFTRSDGAEVEVAYDRYIMAADGTTEITIDSNNGGSDQPIPGTTEVYELRPECRVRLRPFGSNQFQTAEDFYQCCNDPLNGTTLAVDGERITNEIVVPQSSVGTAWTNGGTGSPIGSVNTEIGGDGDFRDLVCQPFKQARDASLDFLYNIDFLAGDRVGFVTFDRGAAIIDPDQDGPLPPMIEDRCLAVEVLTRMIGVRTEPNFYHRDGATVTTDCASGAEIQPWTDFSTGVDENGDSIPIVMDDYETSSVGAWTGSYFVKDSCQFDNAGQGDRFSLWAGTNDDLLDDEAGPLASIATQPENLLGNAWRETFDPFLGTDPDENTYPNQFIGLGSYERNAQCRGTNFGAALRNANNALTDSDTIRRDGTVWVIVLLSDGAAGATDPVPQSPGGTLDLPAPYEREDGSSDPAGNPAPDTGNYGVYGFCPVGTAADPTGYGAQNITSENCSDADPSPDDRNACLTDLDGDPNAKDLSGEIEGVIDQFYNAADCAEYNADDYARDWADFVARNRPGQTDLQLPTIYTIGFNLEYENEDDTLNNTPGVNALCEANIAACAGETLLRYIADIGDNGEYDADYPEAWDDERFAEISYGNYWNAPDEEELRDVFDEIAGKLFVRLTG